MTTPTVTELVRNGLCRIRHRPFNAAARVMPNGASVAGAAAVEASVVGLSRPA
jgi:hypothetical protein